MEKREYHCPTCERYWYVSPDDYGRYLYENNNLSCPECGYTFTSFGNKDEIERELLKVLSGHPIKEMQFANRQYIFDYLKDLVKKGYADYSPERRMYYLTIEGLRHLEWLLDPDKLPDKYPEPKRTFIRRVRY